MNQEQFISGYFKWVIGQAFAKEQSQYRYNGALVMLFNIPFYWLITSDANRAGDASVFRHYERAQLERHKHSIDSAWLDAWANANPSVLEVLVGIAERWHQFYEFEPPYFFTHLFRNLGLHVYQGPNLRVSQDEQIAKIVDRWLSRQFKPNGEGSPFPLKDNKFRNHPDMRLLDIWGQMNAYALENFE